MITISRPFRSTGLLFVVLPCYWRGANRPEVSDERIAKLSLQHAAAVAFVRRRAGARRSVNAADIAAFRTKVVAVADAALSMSEAVVKVEVADRRLSAHITVLKGGLQNPLTDKEIREKARDLASLVGSAVDIDRLADAVWDPDQSNDASTFMAITLELRFLHESPATTLPHGFFWILANVLYLHRFFDRPSD